MPLNCESFNNDWKIVKLQSPLIINADVRPACLPSADFLPTTATNTERYTSGWGDLSFGMYTELFNTHFIHDLSLIDFYH